MKTIEQINTEIQSISIQIKELEKTDNRKDLRQAKNLRNKIPELREMILYLKSNPSELFLKEEKNRLERREVELKKLYDSLLPSDASKFFVIEFKKSFQKEWRTDKLKTQLEFINNILAE